METYYLWIKLAHILGAVVILGTGIGTAFQMLAAYRSRNVPGIALVARNVVKADWLFTTPAVILQPLTGTLLAVILGYSLADRWLLGSVLLYALAGAAWLPVVVLQLRMRDLAVRAAAANEPLPPAYFSLFRWWFALGWPGFGAVLAIFHLMVAKPDL
ncbi:DUF2269 family protein [Antarcticirhabdus aurantiaca]|uniref:DUF2269 domain-containing protein n=1 Tax=Antarcticirhabdus aurantiaca TaxID=2606717 RepID=A0ACD4NLZ2_9HYPH|nr:DUF2269 domain-containing protein [Antarcticirhabdus aurantiaca]WAJ27787.1 DUF2269 domain-containing protein [Jeongeuplla avenae]